MITVASASHHLVGRLFVRAAKTTLRGRGRPERVGAGAVGERAPAGSPVSRSPEVPFMNDLSPIATDQAAPPSPVHRPDAPGAIIAAAQHLLPHLERGQRIDATILRTAMG